LRVARDSRDVMNAGGPEAHRTDACLAFCGEKTLFLPSTL
jgi:hypothetical protein